MLLAMVRAGQGKARQRGAPPSCRQAGVMMRWRFCSRCRGPLQTLWDTAAMEGRWWRKRSTRAQCTWPSTVCALVVAACGALCIFVSGRAV